MCVRVCVRVRVRVRVRVPYVYNSLWLPSVVHHVQLGAAVPLVVPDADGHLGRLQPLEAVTLTATPLVDILEGAGGGEGGGGGYRR